MLGMALARIGENAKDVVEAVKGKLDIVREALPEGMVLKPIYERTDLVNKAVGTATRALIEGSILVAIILFLFLGELRSALVVIVTLPLAMLIAFIGMGQFGPVGQPDVAGGPGHRHRHDGRRRGGHGRERLPHHGRAPGARREGRPDVGGAGGREGSRQPDRVRDPDHHRGVPAAVLRSKASKASCSSRWPSTSPSRWRARCC